MKYSRQRELILQAVQRHPVHPTADMVYESVRMTEPKISLGTVYRNLNLLAENGTLQKLSMPLGGDRFDGRLEPHSHIICINCGQVCDVESTAFSSADHSVEEQTGYIVTGRTVVYSGLCPNCRNHKKTEG